MKALLWWKSALTPITSHEEVSWNEMWLDPVLFNLQDVYSHLSKNYILVFDSQPV